VVNFPIFESLDVEGYGLFRGDEGQAPGLHVTFHPGLTLFLGANGLGKTTIITMIYRMLTGPYDIPGLSGSSALGTTRLVPAPLSYNGRTMFAQRVSDGARSAVAKMTFSLGRHKVRVERRLNDLGLITYMVGDEQMGNDETGSFQTQIPQLAGVWSFGDWIVLLRHLVLLLRGQARACVGSVRPAPGVAATATSHRICT
jgi:DNA repair exonuclease SbcCD ATPase subunit